ncbi:MAG: hypothetical protein J6B41_02740 [Alistipes sp.]|nr:hypothetical protein [Alistipes sp.]
MKKLFFVAVAAIAMLATSCSKDDASTVVGGETSTVTFAVEAPVMATRALGDGTTAVDLSWAVYAEDGTYLEALSGSKAGAFSSLKANVEIELVNGKKYAVIFWAQAPGAPYTFNKAAKKVTVADALTANQEAYDAFYKYETIAEVAGPRTQTIVLTRPFAQLNIATADTQKAADGGLVVKQTKVVVPAYKTLNLVDGSVADEAERTYAMADILTGETIEVGGKKYDLLSMNYLLVNAKELEIVKFTVKNGTFEEEFTYNNVPLQRNYKTNIIGNLLTSTYDFTIEINPIFADEYDSDAIEVAKGVLYNIVEKTYTLTSVAGLKWFAEQTDGVTRAEATFDTNGGEFKGYKVVLGADMDLAGEAWTPIASGSKVFRGTFDGNGKTISNLQVVATDKSPVGLFAKSRGLIKNVTIKNVDIVGHYKAGAIVGDGLCSHVENCHVDGGSIVITPLNEDDGNHAGGIVGYLSAETTASVKDCSVKNLTVSAYRDVAGLVGTVTGSKAAVVTNGKVENVTVIADQSVAYKEDKAFNAGEIVGRNSKGVDLSSCQASNVTIKNQVNNKALNFALKQNVENINVVLAENATVDVTAWETLAFGGDKTKSIAIEGNDKKLTFNQTNSDWNNITVANGAKLIIKNATLTNAGYNDGPWNRHDLNFACDVELDNVFSDKAIALKAGGKLNKVTINDKNTSDTYALWIQPNGQTVTLTDCTIDMLDCSDGRGIKIDEQYVSAPEKVILNVSKTVFKTEEKAAILVKSVAGAEINVSEIDITAVAADTEFAVWVDEASKAHAAKVVVNGANVKVEGTVVTIEEVSTVEELKEALVDAGTAGAGNTVIEFAEGTYEAPADWTPIKVDGYNGADIVTLNGNNATIKGLKGALFAGGFAGGSGIVIKDLTIEDATIVADNTQGYGAFVNCADSMDEITLINCHLKNSTIITPNDGANSSRIGGLVGWTAGYNNQNDGPVDSYITIKDCSVVGCTIKGFGSIGGICGHAGANAATFTTIENCTVTNNHFISTDDGGWRVGVVVGTANNGQCVIKNITESGNTLEQVGKTAPEGDAKRHYYGRFVPSGTGTLVIDGVNIQ